MEISELPKNKKIILFDGICNLCESSIIFIIEKDKKDIFRFVSLQSDLGLKIIKYLGIDTNMVDSIILYEPGKAYYYKAEAALKIAGNLDGLYSFLSLFSFLPLNITNSIYDYVAKNRYKWYGKKESCMLPTPELKAKFLE